MDNMIKLKAAYVFQRNGCDFQDDHQAAWCEIDQASTPEADKDQDRPARCGMDYIASRYGDQNKTDAGEGLCERRVNGSRAQTRLRLF